MRAWEEELCLYIGLGIKGKQIEQELGREGEGRGGEGRGGKKTVW